MDVVRGLGRGPERQLAVRLPVGERGVLLHRKMRAPLVEERVLEHDVRFRQRGVDVAELHRHGLVDVVSVAVEMDARVLGVEGVLDRGDGIELGVLDDDRAARPLRGLLVDRGDGRNGIADEADLVEAERVLVLADGQDAIGDRQVAPHQNGRDARHLGGGADVD